MTFEVLRNLMRLQRVTRPATRGRRRGATLLVVALGAVFLCGCAALAVDYGLLVNDKNHWQRGVDAAALAGAQELKTASDDALNTANARRVAIAVAGENGVPVSSSGVTFLDDNTRIRVESTNVRSLYFARVIGIPLGTVNAFAVAGITAAGGAESAAPIVVPIGITLDTVNTYTKPALNTDAIPLTLPRVVDEVYGLNDFIVFDLTSNSSKSPPAMRRQLINGYSKTKIGDFYNSLNASESVVNSNFLEALADRFLRSSQEPWNDYWSGNVLSSTGIRYTEIASGTARADNPRVMNLVVNRGGGPSGGTTLHEVIAFQPVYVEAWRNGQLVVRFLPASFGNSDASGSNGSKVISLLE